MFFSLKMRSLISLNINSLRQEDKLYSSLKSFGSSLSILKIIPRILFSIYKDITLFITLSTIS